MNLVRVFGLFESENESARLLLSHYYSKQLASQLINIFPLSVIFLLI